MHLYLINAVNVKILIPKLYTAPLICTSQLFVADAKTPAVRVLLLGIENRVMNTLISASIITRSPVTFSCKVATLYGKANLFDRA